MGIFSLNWFKSKKQDEMDALKIEEQRIKNEILRKQLYVNEEDVLPIEIRKPYKKVKLVNNVLTVLLNDGSIVSKPNATQKDFEAIRGAFSEADILRVVASEEVMNERRKEEAEIKRIQALKEGIKTLEGLDDFEIEGNSVILTGTGRTLPQLLVEKFIQVVREQKYYGIGNNLQDRLNKNEEFQALKRFFMWCCLNPRAEVADDLYGFLMKNSFRITKQGFFVALRNVVTLHGSTELVQFVSNAYNKVKAVWKKNPANYEVFLQNGEYKMVPSSDLYKTRIVKCEECDGTGEYLDEEYDEFEDCGNCGGEGQYEETEEINHGEHIGNLTALYLDLPNRAENRFTDDYTKTFDIRVGRVVNMPSEECNWNRADCGHAGLHFTADEIHYVGCGDQSVLVLINPMKVVGIGEHKGRCYEYLPIMTVPREEATEILHDLDFDTLELDEDYANQELQDLFIKAKEGFVVEASKHQFNIPQMSDRIINNIVASLEDMKSSIQDRVVNH